MDLGAKVLKNTWGEPQSPGEETAVWETVFSPAASWAQRAERGIGRGHFSRATPYRPKSSDHPAFRY